MGGETFTLFLLLSCISLTHGLHHCAEDGPEDCGFSTYWTGDPSANHANFCSWTSDTWTTFSLRPEDVYAGLNKLNSSQKGNLTSRSSCSTQGDTHCLIFSYFFEESDTVDLSVILASEGDDTPEELLWSKSSGTDIAMVPVTSNSTFRIVFRALMRDDRPGNKNGTVLIDEVRYLKSSCPPRCTVTIEAFDALSNTGKGCNNSSVTDRTVLNPSSTPSVYVESTSLLTGLDTPLTPAPTTSKDGTEMSVTVDFNNSLTPLPENNTVVDGHSDANSNITLPSVPTTNKDGNENSVTVDLTTTMIATVPANNTDDFRNLVTVDLTSTLTPVPTNTLGGNGNLVTTMASVPTTNNDKIESSVTADFQATTTSVPTNDTSGNGSTVTADLDTTLTPEPVTNKNDNESSVTVDLNTTMAPVPTGNTGGYGNPITANLNTTLTPEPMANTGRNDSATTNDLQTSPGLTLQTDGRRADRSSNSFGVIVAGAVAITALIIIITLLLLFIPKRLLCSRKPRRKRSMRDKNFEIGTTHDPIYGFEVDDFHTLNGAESTSSDQNECSYTSYATTAAGSGECSCIVKMTDDLSVIGNAASP